MEPQDIEKLNLASIAQEYSSPDAAREFLESLRWPNGAICPHCQNDGKEKPNSKLTAKKGSRSGVRNGVYFCGACRKQFTVTVGTVLEDSHVPINKWLIAFYLIGSSKKAISAHQLHRTIGVSYKTAWFIAHRIRFALGIDSKSAKQLNGTVEYDETFVGPKSNDRNKFATKSIVAALIQRNGEVRTRIIASITQKNVREFVDANASKDSIVNTDQHGAYVGTFKAYKRHDRVNHSRKEYSRRNQDGSSSGVNHCESFFSLLKRGIVGAFHHISREHLSKYSNEFAFRWNTRDLTDGERFTKALNLIGGKRLTYRAVEMPKLAGNSIVSSDGLIAN